ncbi:hypothetical protein OSB04_015390 [Centaurea solstitialis]|uniref:HMA domain-containing protein n=1 Tax=Centaurea solstitialis TaxID=347529 RepID=A0AA38WGH8_9ASTR|nr:hypothetical protein OSB04_015390 [Centaurea solstitialis]
MILREAPQQVSSKDRDKDATQVRKMSNESNDGVCSVELQGDNKNQMVVTGDGIDAATLTSLVRKKVKHASLETVQQI